MADVFVSYARSTERQAEQACAALRAAGYSAWRDDELPAHRPYGEVIEERLQAAGAVVVLWSAEAIKSQWVRAEAEVARGKGTLVQASVDGTVPPIPFNQIQCADLADWDGDPAAAGWRKVVDSVTTLVGERRTDGQPPATSAKRAPRSICVLPFANMSADPEQEYFSDGISEDITTDLSNISSLAVVARNTAFTFKGKAVDVAQVARQLNVTHVLEGSVRKAGQRVRITAQLIDGATGDHLWAERYDRDLTDIFAIQDEISKAIVSALKLKLLPEEKKAMEQRGTNSAEAYDLYLMARQLWTTGNHGDRRREERVLRICRRIVEIDPNYARAWALMAIAQAGLRYGYGVVGDDDGEAAARRAIELDPGIAEAYCVLARRLAEQGRFDEARDQLATALKLDPASWDAHRDAARLDYTERRFADAARHYAAAVEQVETDFHTWGMLGSCYEALGDREAAIRTARKTVEQCERVLDDDPANGAALAMLAGALGALGEKERAREIVDRALLVDPDNMNTRYNLACMVALHLDEPDLAIDLLEPTFEAMTRSRFNTAMGDPDLASLHEHPRFKVLMERVAKAADAERP
jgi:adenylate cyclase